MTAHTAVKNPMITQVGGSHYKTLPIQPAEFWIKNQLPSTQGAIVKYITRHRGAKGRQDLEKALHFVDMLMYWHFDVNATIAPATWSENFEWQITPEWYCKKNEITDPAESAAIILTCRFFCREHLELAKGFIQGAIDQQYGNAADRVAARINADTAAPADLHRATISRKNQAIAVAINRLDDVHSHLIYQPIKLRDSLSASVIQATLNFLRAEFDKE